VTHAVNTMSNTYQIRGSGMDAKKKLQRYSWIERNIKHLEDRLMEMETDIQRMTQRFNDMPTAEGQHDKYSDKISDMIDLKKEINDEVLRKWKEVKEVERMIESLNETEQNLIRLKYIDCLSWVECAVEMSYSWQHLHYIHKKILNKLNIR